MRKMTITLSFAIITATNWDPSLDALGTYKLKIRKTPQEMRQEKAALARAGNPWKPKQYRFETRYVIEHDAKIPTTVYFLPGLWPRVEAELQKRGIPYEIIDKREAAKKPPIDTTQLEGIEFRENQDVALALIATSDCGIIETTVGWGKSFLVGVVCKVFPTLNIVVATSSASVVGTLYDYIKQMIPGQVGYLYARGNTSMGKRVVVTTLKSLEKIPTENVDLLLIDECHDVGATKSADVIMRFCFARRFGFSATPVRNDGSGLVMESLFGPTIMRMTYEQSVEADMVTPMKYVMLPCNWCPPFAQKPDLPDFMLKRWSYWDNAARNKLVREFVYRLKTVSDCQILIMVATLEHAIMLHRLMPWFVVAYYGNVNMTELQKRFPASKYPDLDLSKYKMTSKQLDITRHAFAKGTLRYVISTFVFRQGEPKVMPLGF